MPFIPILGGVALFLTFCSFVGASVPPDPKRRGLLGNALSAIEESSTTADPYPRPSSVTVGNTSINSSPASLVTVMSSVAGMASSTPVILDCGPGWIWSGFNADPEDATSFCLSYLAYGTSTTTSLVYTTTQYATVYATGEIYQTDYITTPCSTVSATTQVTVSGLPQDTPFKADSPASMTVRPLQLSGVRVREEALDFNQTALDSSLSTCCSCLNIATPTETIYATLTMSGTKTGDRLIPGVTTIPICMGASTHLVTQTVVLFTQPLGNTSTLAVINSTTLPISMAVSTSASTSTPSNEVSPFPITTSKGSSENASSSSTATYSLTISTPGMNATVATSNSEAEISSSNTATTFPTYLNQTSSTPALTSPSTAFSLSTISNFTTFVVANSTNMMASSTSTELMLSTGLAATANRSTSSATQPGRNITTALQSTPIASGTLTSSVSLASVNSTASITSIDRETSSSEFSAATNTGNRTTARSNSTTMPTLSSSKFSSSLINTTLFGRTETITPTMTSIGVNITFSSAFPTTTSISSYTENLTSVVTEVITGTSLGPSGFFSCSSNATCTFSRTYTTTFEHVYTTAVTGLTTATITTEFLSVYNPINTVADTYSPATSQADTYAILSPFIASSVSTDPLESFSTPSPILSSSGEINRPLEEIADPTTIVYQKGLEASGMTKAVTLGSSIPMDKRRFEQARHVAPVW